MTQKTFPKWLLVLMVGVGLMLPLLYVLRILTAYDNPMDFRYFWGVGRIWAEGGNPYATAFAQTMTAIFTSEGLDHLLINQFHRWLYSPHIWMFSRPLAGFDFNTAFWVWTLLNTALIYLGTVLVVTAFLTFERAWHWAVLVTLLVYTVVSIGGVMSLTVGQFSGAIYCGAAAFAHAAIRGRFWMMVFALVLLTMKASIGLPFVAFALVVARFRLAVVLAAVISIALTLPSLLSEGVGAVLFGYLEGVQVYAGYEPNAPYSMTGLRTLIYYLTGADLSGLVMALLGSVAVAGIAWIGQRNDVPPAQVTLAVMAVILFVVPLHLYDLMLVSILAIGLVSPWFAVLFLGVLVALFRVNRVSEIVGIEEQSASFDGSLLASLLLGCLLVATLVLFRKGFARLQA